MPSTAPYLELWELVGLFGYKNENVGRTAIYQGTFPVPTYKLAGRIVADVEVVKKYFKDIREEHMIELERMKQLRRRRAALTRANRQRHMARINERRANDNDSV